MGSTDNKKFRPVLRRLTIIPLLAMTVTLVICIAACVYSFRGAEEQLEERSINALEIGLSQMDAVMDRVEQPFIEYVSKDSNHHFLKRCTEATPPEASVVYESNVRKWLDEQVNKEPSAQTAFVYYKNMNRLQFRGASAFAVQNYVTDQLHKGGEDTAGSGWRLIRVEGRDYLLYILNAGSFWGGEWIPLEDLERYLGLSREKGAGDLYLTDARGCVACGNAELETQIALNPEARQLEGSERQYRNYLVKGREHGISIGLCSPQAGFWETLPTASRVLFVAAFAAIVLVAVVILWLQRRIVRPVREIDEAMKIIAEGNLDYRLPVTDYQTYNEFDRLSMHFNAMMDKLDEAQFKLYQTTLREQKNKLSYISRQIRPHFILNALNIIYTYDESEFALVKKMVLYLTAYFRYIVNLNRDFVEVSGELEHTRNYLKIQKERYPHRFDYLVECEMKAERLLIPPLIIQTFLENSIKYGMKDEGQTFFFVNVAVRGEMAEIFIADTGKGFGEETLAKINRFLESREYTPELGVGIQNTVERLEILYGGEARLDFSDEETGGAVVRILVPARYNEDGEEQDAGELPEQNES